MAISQDHLFNSIEEQPVYNKVSKGSARSWKNNEKLQIRLRAAEDISNHWDEHLKNTHWCVLDQKKS